MSEAVIEKPRIDLRQIVRAIQIQSDRQPAHLMNHLEIAGVVLPPLNDMDAEDHKDLANRIRAALAKELEVSNGTH